MKAGSQAGPVKTEKIALLDKVWHIALLDTVKTEKIALLDKVWPDS